MSVLVCLVHWNSHDAKRLLVSQEQALSYFKNLERKSIPLGLTRLGVWGHSDVSERLHTLPDGSLLALVGSPHGAINWLTVQETLSKNERTADFELPWDGRAILLRASADGGRWTMWNDWVGSIPVFHAEIGRGRAASTLEPVVVASAAHLPTISFLPAVVSLLINGHYLSDWTLYKGMKVALPDSRIDWDENGFRVKPLWSVEPSQSRVECGLGRPGGRDARVVPKGGQAGFEQSSKMDSAPVLRARSRLIAGCGGGVPAPMPMPTHGVRRIPPDVVNSQKIARALGFPWKHIDLPKDFLVKYTPQWATWFGSAMHFHGMYQMSFLEQIRSEPDGPVLSGFIGEVLAGDSVNELSALHSLLRNSVNFNDWYVHFTAKEIRSFIKQPVEDAMEINAAYLKNQLDTRCPEPVFRNFSFWSYGTDNASSLIFNRPYRIIGEVWQIRS
ncbi:MAG: hypothetical protein MZW92_75905 [Comamonadaceae bacterium]|nr:hypothetical protein [Comamonadaceae bacterium]